MVSSKTVGRLAEVSGQAEPTAGFFQTPIHQRSRGNTRSSEVWRNHDIHERDVIPDPPPVGRRSIASEAIQLHHLVITRSNFSYVSVLSSLDPSPPLASSQSKSALYRKSLEFFSFYRNRAIFNEFVLGEARILKDLSFLFVLFK